MILLFRDLKLPVFLYTYLQFFYPVGFLLEIKVCHYYCCCCYYLSVANVFNKSQLRADTYLMLGYWFHGQLILLLERCCSCDFKYTILITQRYASIRMLWKRAFGKKLKTVFYIFVFLTVFMPFYFHNKAWTPTSKGTSVKNGGKALRVSQYLLCENNFPTCIENP